MSTVLQKILEWSNGKIVPTWQRDALRRLLVSDRITQNDLDELTTLCRSERGLAPRGRLQPVDAEPLNANHCAMPDTEIKSVRFASLSNAEGVNALAGGQTIDFCTDGITVIYGDNGTGKSGYGRLFRTLCGARGQKNHTILSNIYKPSSPPPSCKLNVLIDGSPTEVVWSADQPPPPILGSVGIFDSKAAHCYVAEENDVAFMPFGLDLFDQLCDICKEIKERLNSELAELEQRPNYQDLFGDHPVGRFIAALSHQTSLEKLTELAIFTAVHEDELKIAEEKAAGLRANSPEKMAREHRNRAGRYEKAEKAIVSLAAQLSDKAVVEHRSLVEARNLANKSAEEAATVLSTPGILPGTGAATWQAMWEAAKSFSIDRAYSGREFPVVDNAQCLLCQQPLDTSATKRLKQFESFVRKDIQEEARRLSREVVKHLEELKLLKPLETVEATTLEELGQVSDGLDVEIKAFLATCDMRLKGMMQMDNDPTIDIAFINVEPSGKVKMLVQGHRDLAGELDKIESNTELEKLEALIRALRAQKRLMERHDQIKEDIERLRKTVKVEACLVDVKTRPISTQAGALTDEYVTQDLRNRFDTELKKLDRYGFKIALKGRTDLGRVYHRVGLVGSEQEAPIKDILSEGEFRCVALAGFLTELASAQATPPLIFDDPVSSLDDRWRRKVSERLVEEAGVRQVIVFTHNMEFMRMLEKDAKPVARSLIIKHLERGPDQTVGVCGDDAPWRGKKYKQRKGIINAKFQAAEAAHLKVGQEAYEKLAIELYGDLRSTWECALEFELLNGVIRRFDSDVHTTKFDKVAGYLHGEDYIIVNKGMTRCSAFMPGHNSTDQIPLPAELREDIDMLFNLIDEVAERRKLGSPSV